MSFSAPTIHNEAKPGEIAESVLMPGDPLRARFIAETFLEKPVQFNGVRGMLGYTGTYKGRRVSTMGSGMGMPSIGIYSYELFNFYGVKNIIRVGSAGAISSDVKLYDIVIAMGACHDSNFANQYKLGYTYAPICSYELLEKAVKSAREKNIPVKVGNICSGDVFYSAAPDVGNLSKMGVLAGEMEAAALYMNAAYAEANALCIVTISDIIGTKEVLSSEERQTSFTKMIEVALETV